MYKMESMKQKGESPIHGCPALQPQIIDKSAIFYINPFSIHYSLLVSLVNMSIILDALFVRFLRHKKNYRIPGLTRNDESFKIFV